MNEISNEAAKMIYFIVKKISTMKYAYKDLFEGAYDARINNYGLKEPKEGKDFCANKAIKILNKYNK